MLPPARARPARRAVSFAAPIASGAATLVILLFLVVGPEVGAASPAVRLAEAFAAEVARTARGRPVELRLIEDRTGRGAPFAMDLQSLVLARLQGTVSPAAAGPRLRIEPVLTESPGRLVVSARVVDEPAGRLLDVLSASVETDRDVLTFAALPPTGATVAVDVVSSFQTPPLGEPVLALAFLGERRLVVLFPEAVALFRWEPSGLSLESRSALPGPFATVRAAAGVLLASEAEGTFWALTNRSPRAVLFAVEGGRCLRREDAAAIPWPSTSDGLRFRPGTNLIEASLPTLGSGPFLTLHGGLAVLDDGRLVPQGAPDIRIGPALATLWPGVIAAASARPPGGQDQILLLASDAAGVRRLDAIPVEGAVRALATPGSSRALTHDPAAAGDPASSPAEGGLGRLVAAVEAPGGTYHFLVLDLGLRR